MKKLVLLTGICLLFIRVSEAHPGVGIVIDKAGNIFYTDLVHVWKISPNGERTIAVKNVHTHELYLDAQGDLYGEHEWYEGEATDKWGNYVWCLSKDGVFEKVIPDTEGFLDNTTLIRDPLGNSYWAKESGKGRVIMKQSPSGSNDQFSHHTFNNIRWMHFSPYDNHLYVVDHLAVKRIAPSGDVSVLSGNLKENSPTFNGVADHHYIFGLWTDPEGNVYVALFGGSKVKRISPDGNISTAFTSPEGWSPTGGLIDSSGSMWLMEFSKRNQARIRKVVRDGEDLLFGE